MVRNGKLSKIAKERGTTLDELIPQAVEEHGSIFRAALSLNVTPTAIQNWMRNNGWKAQELKRTRLVRVDEAV